MTRRDIATLIVQYLGLRYLVDGFRQTPYWIQYVRLNPGLGKGSEYYSPALMMVAYLLYFVIGIALLLSARRIAKWMTVDMEPSAVQAKVVPKEFLGVAISVIGVWLLAAEMPRIAGEWAQYFVSLSKYSIDTWTGPKALGGVLVVLFALWLTLGWRGIGRAISGLRNAGVNYPDDTDAEDEDEEEEDGEATPTNTSPPSIPPPDQPG